ncbi:MAG: hypothetical protein ACRYFU_17770 [Janthinobacterium lividum]
MSMPQQPIFLSDETFELLVQKVPHDVIRGTDFANFEETIGTTRDRFESIVQALGAGGRTQGFIGHETAGYLRNALGVAISELEPMEFYNRTGFDREDAMNIMRGLTRATSADPTEVN